RRGGGAFREGPRAQARLRGRPLEPLSPLVAARRPRPRLARVRVALADADLSPLPLPTAALGRPPVGGPDDSAARRAGPRRHPPVRPLRPPRQGPRRHRLAPGAAAVDAAAGRPSRPPARRPRSPRGLPRRWWSPPSPTPRPAWRPATPPAS